MTVVRANADVVIAGGGPAAAAAAISLASSGIDTLLLVSPRHTLKMAEAIPAAALSLFEALGLTDLIRGIGTVLRGVENRWELENPVTRGDSFVVVDRAEFARRMLGAAVSRGVSVEAVSSRPALISRADRIAVEISGRTREFDCAIDATGRAAIWSSPVQRMGRMIAGVFEAPPFKRLAGLKLVRTGHGWAYLIGRQNYTTVGMISPRHQSDQFPEQIADELGTLLRDMHSVGRRPATVQWAMSPIRDRVIAVGDAALAHDPISGQGIRFALASAIAAAAVIRTWRRFPFDRKTPADFYTDFVTTERERHLRFIQSFYGEQLVDGIGHTIETSQAAAVSNSIAQHSELGAKLYFSGHIESAPLHLNGYIERGETLRGPDNRAFRWLGGFDLLRLRDLARDPVTIPSLIQMLILEGLDADRAAVIIDWCVVNRILGIAASERRPPAD